MSKVMFFILQGHGHVNATLPLAGELASRGEEVIYYSVDRFRSRIEDTGAQYRSYPRSFYIDENQSVKNALLIFMQCASDLLAQELQRIRDDRPDYLVLDTLSFPGWWVAEALKIPIVLVSTTFVPNRQVMSLLQPGDGGAQKPKLPEMMQTLHHWRQAAELKKELQCRYSLQGPQRMACFEGGEVNLVYASRYLHPFAETFDPSVRFIGRSLPGIEDDAQLKVPAGDGPLVYLSMGTVFSNNTALFRGMYGALDGSRVLLTTGGKVKAEELGDIPDNVLVRDFLALPEALAANKRADVFVTHGGMGSITESMHYGVPVVVVPQVFEQAVIGRRVEELGAGVCLNAQQLNPASLRDAVNRVHGDQSYAAASRRIGDSFRESGGVQEAVEAVMEVKRRTGLGTWT